MGHDQLIPRGSGSEPNDPSFESIYAAAGGDLESIPWAHLTPNAAMAQWADHLPTGRAIAGAFDAIVEIRALQSLTPGTREQAARAIAALLAPGGRLLVICYGREDDRRPEHRPWPVTRTELEAFTDAGLQPLRFDDQPLTSPGDRTWTVDYARADA